MNLLLLFFYEKEIMESIKLGKRVLKIREESYGYTIFDGNVSIQANKVFIFILKCIAEGYQIKEIQDKLCSKYNNIASNDQVQNDIQYVFKYAKNMKWL